MLNLVRNTLGLIWALGYRQTAVVGHDFGSFLAGWCALVRPDVFRCVALMGAPFAGPPPLPLAPAVAASSRSIHDELAALPRPRKHYQWYYSTRAANDNMWHCPQGVHAFLRAYYHVKADWKPNRPFPLKAWSAAELAKLPTYYVMDLDKGMAETMAPAMPSAAQIAACRWLPESQLRVYSAIRPDGIPGRLAVVSLPDQRPVHRRAANLLRTHDRRPLLFIAGKSDWGIYQKPGDIDRMRNTLCTRMRGCHLIDGAGHWVQQEQPEEVNRLLVPFLQQSLSSS